MKVKVLTLIPRADTGQFDTEALDAFVAEHDVLSVAEHFFVHEGQPRWGVLLGYRAAAGPLPRPVEGREDPRTQLLPEELPVFEALRSWRNERAREEGKPAYAIFNNNQLIAIARARPATKSALGAVPGVGEARLEAYGGAIWGLVGGVPARGVIAGGEGGGA